MRYLFRIKQYQVAFLSNIIRQAPFSVKPRTRLQLDTRLALGGSHDSHDHARGPCAGTACGPGGPPSLPATLQTKAPEALERRLRGAPAALPAPRTQPAARRPDSDPRASRLHGDAEETTGGGVSDAQRCWPGSFPPESPATPSGRRAHLRRAPTVWAAHVAHAAAPPPRPGDVTPQTDSQSIWAPSRRSDSGV